MKTGSLITRVASRGVVAPAIAAHALVLIASMAASWPTLAAESEWPQWRGPDRTNISRDTGLLAEWPPDGPPLLWKATGLGEGVPSVAVAGGCVFTLGYQDQSEFLTAWNTTMGTKIWDARVGPAIAEMSNMRWLSQRTPTVDADRIYVVTAAGELICLATADGAERWRKNYSTDFSGRRGPWGFCDYPLVDGGHLICTPGGETASMVALDKQTGEVVWKCAVPNCKRSTYSAVIAADLAGVRQYVQQFDTGVAGVGTDGKSLWNYGALSDFRGNVHTAIAAGDDRIFSSCGWNRGDVLLKVTAGQDHLTADVEYRDTAGGRAFESWIGNSSLVKQHVYTNNGYCLKLKTGGIAWAAKLGNRITAVVPDGREYYRLTDGTMVLGEANPEKFVERGRFQPPRSQTKEPAWSSPVVAGWRLYLRDQDELLCYDLRIDRSKPLASPATRPAASRRPATQPDARKTSGIPPAGDAIFVPTPQDVVERMLELAAVTRNDVVYDLGCGDGRIVVTAAALYGCRAAGYDTDTECVRLARESVAERKVCGFVDILPRDIFTVDLAGASVVTLYLGRDVNRRLVPQLEKLRPGSRIVSHAFDLEGFEPDKVIQFRCAEDDATHVLYLWTTPLRSSKVAVTAVERAGPDDHR